MPANAASVWAHVNVPRRSLLARFRFHAFDNCPTYPTLFQPSVAKIPITYAIFFSFFFFFFFFFVSTIAVSRHHHSRFNATSTFANVPFLFEIEQSREYRSKTLNISVWFSLCGASRSTVRDLIVTHSRTAKILRDFSPDPKL